MEPLFWVFLMVVAILLFVLKVVKMGTRYCENMERIKRGYPTLDGSTPIKAKESEEDEVFNRIQ